MKLEVRKMVESSLLDLSFVWLSGVLFFETRTAVFAEYLGLHGLEGLESRGWALPTT